MLDQDKNLSPIETEAANSPTSPNKPEEGEVSLGQIIETARVNIVNTSDISTADYNRWGSRGWKPNMTPINRWASGGWRKK